MNKVFLMGNVGQDPRITTFQDGGKVAQFSLATTERGYETKDGKKVEDVTDWHNIVVKRTGLAGVCEQYVKKGTPLLIVGRMKTREYKDNAGQSRYVTEVVVDELTLLHSGQKREQAPAPAPEDFRPGEGTRQQDPVSGGYAPMKDDLPFL